jgi:ABC-type Fe3+-hydroxamate transport system substrate-binding protein
MKTVIDQLGRTVSFSYPPRRIISLVPSQTELLASLALDEEVVGITRFCTHPPAWFGSKKRVGGTKQLRFSAIEDLQPDLIIGNREENDREQIEWLSARYPVWLSDIYTLSGALDMILRLGEICDRSERAVLLTEQISRAFEGITRPMSVSAAYLIWREPYMAAAANTFIDDMLQRAGFTNVFGDRQRYPELTAAELAAAAPEVVLLSSEPYPFSGKHVAELQAICRQARVLLVDGAAFSWYGSRLLSTAAYLQTCYHAATRYKTSQ